MSRIGKQPIIIPEKTSVVITDGTITVTGPLGSLVRSFKEDVSVTEREGAVVVTPAKDTQAARALWGTYASHIGNMVRGVNEKFEKKLLIEGVGFRAETDGTTLTLSVGFSHPVKLGIPSGIEVSVEKNLITVSGIDKEVVGEFAANIRATKKPEPYKGKGIRYETEVVRRKQGKKAAA